MTLTKEMWSGFEVYLLVEKKHAQSNVEVFKYIFANLARHFSTIDFNRENFNTFLMEMKKRHKTSYLNQFIRLVKHLDKYLKLDEFSNYSLFPELPMKELDVLTEDEILKLANLEVKYRINRQLLNLRMKCLILLIGSVGCRISEALNLTWNDIKSTYVVFKDTKNGQTRYAPILPKLYEQIISIQNFSPTRVTKDHGNVVFQTCEQNVNRDLKLRKDICGIKKEVYCHALRHAVITNLLKQGVSVPLVAKLVGHESWNSTAKYTHIILDDVENMLYTYSPLWKDGLSFDMLKNRVRSTVQKMVTKYNIEIQEENGRMVITIAQ